MLKTTLYGTALAAVLGFLLFGTSLFSYMGTAFSWAQKTAESNIPIEMKIERAQQLIDGLEGEIRKSHHLIFEAEARVENQRAEVASLDDKLQSTKKATFRLHDDLNSGKPLVYKGVSYSEERVKRDLKGRLSQIKSTEARLTAEHDALNAYENQLDAVQKRHEALLAAKHKAQAQLEQLKAKLEAVRAQQIEADFNFDDSTTGELKEILSEIETHVNAEDAYAKSKSDADYGSIPVEEETNTEDALNEIARMKSEADSKASTVAAEEDELLIK